LDEFNKPTTVGMSFLPSSWWTPYAGGPSTNNNSGVYPDVVLKEYYYFAYYGGPTNPSVAVTGLNPAKKYDLTFFAGSTFSSFSDNGSTTYTVGTQSVALAVQNNTKNTVTLTALTPAADGSITVNMGRLTNGPPGYLNSIVISNRVDDSIAPAAPVNLQAQGVSGKGVNLTWKDVAYNEIGYRIYRSTKDSLSFSLIATTANNVSSYTDSSVSGNTQYYYKVNAFNTYGISAFTNTASLLTQNRIPQVLPIANVTVNNTQSVKVNVTALDDSTARLVLKASGLPSFASFVDNGNGTGVVTITPTTGLQGTFSGITITATDQVNASGSAVFNINVVDPNLSYTYVNITNSGVQAPAPWNNLNIPYLPYAGMYASGLTDQTGANTGITVTLTDAWQGVSFTGVKRRNGSDLYPENVSNNAIYASDANNRRITVTGLNTTKRYNFQFYASHNTSESTLTNFMINGQTISLNGSYNSNKTAQINEVIPDNNGTVVINCAKDPSASFVLLSALVIEAFTPGNTIPFSPADLRVLDYTRTNTIGLQWQDRASNETAYEVWRANAGGGYSKLVTLPANTTSYLDANLPANTTYNYIVRAAKDTIYSPFSNPVKGNTYATSVFINFNGVNAVSAGLPWNNTKWVSQSVGTVWNNFLDETGRPTNIGMVQPTRWDAINDHGVVTGNNSGIFPDAVMSQSFGLFVGDSSRLTITGLDLTKTYDFTMFASCTDDATQNSTAKYIINGKSSLLNAHINRSGTLTMFGIVPDQYGNVNITVTAYDSSNSSFSLIGALIIKGYTLSTAALTPAPSKVVVTSNARTTAVSNQFTIATPAVVNKPLSVYPNPFDQNFTLSVPAINNDNIVVAIADVNGKVLYQKHFENLVQGSNFLLIQSDRPIPAGVYFIRVIYTNRNEQKLLKVIKQ
jgi:fibronectin type 3 domain-containing protein